MWCLCSAATGLSDHDVVIVSIPDAQDVGGHAVAAAGVEELLHSLLELRAQDTEKLKPLCRHS